MMIIMITITTTLLVNMVIGHCSKYYFVCSSSSSSSSTVVVVALLPVNSVVGMAMTTVWPIWESNRDSGKRFSALHIRPDGYRYQYCLL
jgi:hypothetical protein